MSQVPRQLTRLIDVGGVMVPHDLQKLCPGSSVPTGATEASPCPGGCGPCRMTFRARGRVWFRQDGAPTVEAVPFDVTWLTPATGAFSLSDLAAVGASIGQANSSFPVVTGFNGFLEGYANFGLRPGDPLLATVNRIFLDGVFGPGGFPVCRPSGTQSTTVARPWAVLEWTVGVVQPPLGAGVTFTIYCLVGYRAGGPVLLAAPHVRIHPFAFCDGFGVVYSAALSPAASLFTGPHPRRLDVSGVADLAVPLGGQGQSARLEFDELSAELSSAACWGAWLPQGPPVMLPPPGLRPEAMVCEGCGEGFQG